MSFYGSLISIASASFKNCMRKPVVESFRLFHSSSAVRGFEEFKDQLKADEVMKTGRAWTNADLRRKSFEDLHKLWYVLYKERNLLLTTRNKLRTAQKRTPPLEEQRYINVKRSMAAIKHTLDERKKIRTMLAEQEAAAAEKTAGAVEEKR